MAKKADFEIYEGFTKRKKKYVVFYHMPPAETHELEDIIVFCKKFFKCGENHLRYQVGYIYKRQLYLVRPNNKARSVSVITYIR